MLLGRFIQGFGAAAPRTVSMAVIRDRCSGDEMARVMSLIMSVFILVPAVAPAVGQGILMFSSWRGIFVVFILLALIAVVWFGLRQPETLPPVRRSRLRPGVLWGALKEVLTNRISIGYTVAAGLIFGCLISYLGSAQQVLQELYATGNLFPLYFGLISLTIGASSLANARLVKRLGVRRLFAIGLTSFFAMSAVFLVVALLADGTPPLWAFMAYIMPAFFAIGLLFGNSSALAMEPLGHIAGMAAAVIGSLSTLISGTLGALIGQSYDHTVLPLMGAFAGFSFLALLLVRWVERGRAAA
jgi:DHA1 family bicyclomycin/chloramphenicol resistance-like MFS transporter